MPCLDVSGHFLGVSCALRALAEKLGKLLEAVRAKIRRLGLEVDDRNRRICSTTSKLSLPKELPSIEEALQMLAGALKAACEPGLDKVEVQRFPGFRV